MTRTMFSALAAAAIIAMAAGGAAPADAAKVRSKTAGATNPFSPGFTGGVRVATTGGAQGPRLRGGRKETKATSPFFRPGVLSVVGSGAGKKDFSANGAKAKPAKPKLYNPYITTD